MAPSQKRPVARARSALVVLERVHGHLGLAELLARRMHQRLRGLVAFDDLRASAREGLWLAACSYDTTRGLPFAAWAVTKARGRMLDGVRSELGRGASRRRDGAGARRPSEGVAPNPHEAHRVIALRRIDTAEGVLTDVTPDPEARLAARELTTKLRAAVAHLPPKQRALVERVYFHDDTLEEAAHAVGISKSWGSRLHARALRSLARLLAAS